MNDIYYSTALCTAVNCLLTKHRENGRGDNFSVLDMSPLFSTIPIQASRMGVSYSYWLSSPQKHKDIYNVICERNQVTNTRHIQDVEDVRNLSLDCVLCDLIEPNGTLRQHVLNDLAYIKLSSLDNNSGVVIPG